MQKTIKIEWLKCHHGIDKRIDCPHCKKEKDDTFSRYLQLETKDNKIPIKRGCTNKDGCFCTGRCQEIIGYREPLYPGEK